ncbi:hypothetical protein YSY43_01710 [Paenibacillus sp. YSY-4.3]
MSESRKLLLFSHICNKRNITGAEKLLLFLATRLSPYFQCVIVVPKEGLLSRLARRHGIRTIVQNIPLLYGMCLPHEGLAQQIEDSLKEAAFKETSRLLSKERPDYVLVNTSVHVIPAMAAKSMGIPVIWHITEVIASNGYTEASTQIIDRYSDWIICISESAAFPLRGCSAGKLNILYPSWSWSDFSPHKWPQLREQQRHKWKVGSDNRLIGYISSYLTAEKGADHFIEAALILAGQYQQSSFVVIGAEINGPYYLRLQQRVAESPYAERFVFIDYVSDIEAAFSAMDIVIVPSLREEGFGLTAMEAMILGKPVIAYASGGLEEILRLTGNQPFLVSAGDYSELSAKVSRLLEEPGLIESVGSNNRIQIEACFGPEAYEANLQAVLSHMNGLTPNGAGLPALRPVPKSEPRARRGAKKARVLPSAHRRLKSLKRLKRRRNGSRARMKHGARNMRRTRRVSRMRKRGKVRKRLSTGR